MSLTIVESPFPQVETLARRWIHEHSLNFFFERQADSLLYTYQSNRLENLADALAALAETHQLPPTQPEVVVVQSAGMSRWLSMALAQRSGICANVDCVFPAAFLWEQFRRLFDDVPQHSSFALPVLQWRVFQLLSTLGDEPSAAALHHYLQSEPKDIKRFQLAARIADTFDQYLVYRPDWIEAWEAGEDDHWQARMWRQLSTDKAGDHRVALARRFLSQIGEQQIEDAGLPARIAVFGIPSMAPLYFEIFQRLSQFIDVHFFVLNPCQEYWADIASEREVVRKSQNPNSTQGVYLETGNTLLASWGGQGREFMDPFTDIVCEEIDLFEDSAADSVLRGIQSDILNLRRTEQQQRLWRESDCSLQVHVCHSRNREVEVLHEQLLALFETLPDLEPRDIVVMTPDIEAYAPVITSVFGTRPEAQRVPFTIADRRVRNESQLIDTFLKLIALKNARLTSVEILSLLEEESLARRFQLSADDLPRLHQWLLDTNIRWGRDGRHRQQTGVPNEEANTWQAGLNRLILGYAMGPDEQGAQQNGLFDHILPQPVGGSDSRLLGHFVEWVETLFDFLEELSSDRSPQQWTEFFSQMLDRFFDPQEEQIFQLQTLRNALIQLSEHTDIAAFDDLVSIDVVECWLKDCLDQTGQNLNFLSSGVTFCTMMPMRSIPFRVVCLLGMDHTTFPRRHASLGFDLMANDHRRGDRSRRADDRYLFLETLLSARDCFYISYVGRSIRDNSPIPPSVLVNELLECVEQGFMVEPKAC